MGMWWPSERRDYREPKRKKKKHINVDITLLEEAN